MLVSLRGVDQAVMALARDVGAAQEEIDPVAVRP